MVYAWHFERLEFRSCQHAFAYLFDFENEYFVPSTAHSNWFLFCFHYSNKNNVGFFVSFRWWYTIFILRSRFFSRRSHKIRPWFNVQGRHLADETLNRTIQIYIYIYLFQRRFIYCVFVRACFFKINIEQFVDFKQQFNKACIISHSQ